MTLQGAMPITLVFQKRVLGNLHRPDRINGRKIKAHVGQLTFRLASYKLVCSAKNAVHLAAPQTVRSFGVRLAFLNFHKDEPIAVAYNQVDFPCRTTPPLMN